MSFYSDLDREEGFTGAFNRTPWQRRFAWLPVRLTEYPPKTAWLKWIEVKDYGAFGIAQRATRLASIDTHAKRGDSTQIEAPSPMGSAVGDSRDAR